MHGAWFDPNEMRRAIEALVGPPKVDPSVDRLIAEEAERGALRPPENYEATYGGPWGLEPRTGILDVLVELYVALRPRK
jgi:hypothetical protein